MADDDVIRDNCDTAIRVMAQMLIRDAGASGEMLLDRMLTFCAAQAVGWTGSTEAARAFYQTAERIKGGVFAHIEAGKERARH